MGDRISINMSSEEYAMTLLGAPADTSLSGAILSKIKVDLITNNIFQMLRTILKEKYDFAGDEL